jgi:hypothetical protein
MRASRLDIDIEAELARFQARRVTHRSPGRHLSEVMRYIMTKLKPERFGGDGEIKPAMAQGGFIWEDTLSWVFGRQLGMRQIEVEQDGIFLTLDGFDTEQWRTREAKSTKISAANGISSERFWHWHVQIMAGCRAMDTTECELIVLHANGSYEMAGGRFGEPVANPWLVGYTPREIEENWRMILRARDRMENEQ